MKILKKILLIIVGIILSLVILEIGLQILGFTLTTIKEYKNKVTKDPNTITILCLGESTTDGQWPPILQKILDKKSKNKKFNVIDEGHNGKNSEYLFHEVVEKKLLKYNPDIVISMMGANDASSDKPYIVQNEHWYYNFKVYKLIILIKDHLDKKVKYSNFNNAERNINIPSDIINKLKYISNKEIVDNNDLMIVKDCVKKYPNIFFYEEFCPALCKPYFEEIILNKNKEYIFNIDDFLKYYNLNIKYLILDKIYICFAKLFFKHKDIKNAVLCAKTSLRYDRRNYISLISILKFDDININTDKIYKIEYGRYNITSKIYPYMIKYVIDKGMKYYIAMQYPTLPLNELENILKDSPYYNKLIFISNEENFKEALQKYKTEEIFRDMFGGSFGHCTDLGNTFIAENVAETILKLYDINK